MGRPVIEITDEVCAEAESLAGKGLTVSQIARVLGMGESTLYEKQAAYQEFSEAIKAGRAKGIEDISNSLYDNAKDGNVTAQIFYLKNRAPEQWEELQKRKMGIDPETVQQLGVTDLAARLAGILTKAQTDLNDESE